MYDSCWYEWNVKAAMPANWMILQGSETPKAAIAAGEKLKPSTIKATGVSSKNESIVIIENKPIDPPSCTQAPLQTSCQSQSCLAERSVAYTCAWHHRRYRITVHATDAPCFQMLTINVN